MNITEKSPAVLVAHRAGNSQEKAAQALEHCDVIEIDCHVHAGRVEVRHAKTVWPTKRLWDKWYLLPAGTTVPELAEILNEIPADKPLLIDLKCLTVRAARQVRHVIPPDQPVVVACRSWWVLRAFADRQNTQMIRSCGNSRMQLWFSKFVPGMNSKLGLVAHERILKPRIVANIRRRTPVLFSYGLQDPPRAAELIDHGVKGIIVDDLSLDWPNS